MHDYEHEHHDGHEYEHAHSHEHPHAHEHEHVSAKPMEELLALMKYMVGHNEAHTRELEELAHEVEHSGKGEAHDEIMEAVHLFAQGNQALRGALEKMEQ